VQNHFPQASHTVSLARLVLSVINVQSAIAHSRNVQQIVLLQNKSIKPNACPKNDVSSDTTSLVYHFSGFNIPILKEQLSCRQKQWEMIDCLMIVRKMMSEKRKMMSEK
jgi:hypothetical protein